MNAQKARAAQEPPAARVPTQDDLDRVAIWFHDNEELSDDFYRMADDLLHQDPIQFWEVVDDSPTSVAAPTVVAQDGAGPNPPLQATDSGDVQGKP